MPFLAVETRGDAQLAANVRGDGPAGRRRAGRWPCLPRMRGGWVTLAADARGATRLPHHPHLWTHGTTAPPSADAQEDGPVAADVPGEMAQLATDALDARGDDSAGRGLEGRWPCLRGGAGCG